MTMPALPLPDPRGEMGIGISEAEFEALVATIEHDRRSGWRTNEEADAEIRCLMDRLRRR